MMKKIRVALCALLVGCLIAPGAQAQLPAHATNHTVLLNNHTRIVPLRDLGKRTIAYVAPPRTPAWAALGQQLARYAPIEEVVIPADAQAYPAADERLKFHNTIILGIDASDLGNRRLLQFINAQATGKQVILVVLGEGAYLQALEFVNFPILWAPQPTEAAAQQAAMSVFGGLACTARLPRSFSARYATGAGFNTERIRLQYGAGGVVEAPQLGGRIDAIVQEAIRERATPGAVVMVLKSGKVIFERAYGHHTYERRTPTRLSDIFDMASITKIAATTPAIMRLTERHFIDLDSTMGHYLLQAQTTNKDKTTLREVMLHEAGFIPFIPFYRDLKPGDLGPDSSASHAVKVADGCFIRTGYYESVMWPTMLHSKRNAAGAYVYSDISMYVMKEVAEHQTGIPIQDYIQTEFYRPLGMQTAGYLPRQRFARERIVPTEDDKAFRKTLLQGYVHDQGAAMAGGIAGHAGLFATANDLAIYGQLLLNRGEYGGDRYFKAETVDVFSSKQSATSRRGLGFDRSDPDTAKHYPSKLASDATFGHTGYTGTCIWIDPKEQLVYIFLSNRVHPAVSTKLHDLNIRSRIQDAVYESLRVAR